MFFHFCIIFNAYSNSIYQPLLQIPLSEQGGVSHRSVLPQHVEPLDSELPIMMAPGTEINFFNRTEPQYLHTVSSFSLFTNISVILPQFSQLYS